MTSRDPTSADPPIRRSGDPAIREKLLAARVRGSFARPAGCLGGERGGIVTGMAGEDPLEKLRRLCMALPEATERVSHGEPTWFVRGKKSFVMFADHHHDDRLAFWCAAPDGVQQELVAEEGDRFFRPPYVGVRGWLGVYLDVPVDWEEIAAIVADAYCVVAPRKLAELVTSPR